MLYRNILKVTEEEEQETAFILSTEYKREALEYPSAPPEFDQRAAIWGAKTVYIAAQLIQYQENKQPDYNLLFPAFPGEITSSSFLSADLTLRRLPEILVQLKFIEKEAKLIKVLENHLYTWHYSGISYTLDPEKINFNSMLFDSCLKQLYIKRVIEHQKLQLADHPFLKETESNSGTFRPEFWKTFKPNSHFE